MYMREQVILSMIREVGTTGGLPWAFMGCWDDKSGFPIMILPMILDRDFIEFSLMWLIVNIENQAATTPPKD